MKMDVRTSGGARGVLYGIKRRIASTSLVNVA